MNEKSNIFIIGKPVWAKTLQNRLSEYQIYLQAQQQGYMNALIEKRAALIFIDGSEDNWSIWASTPKSSPATRRIPIFLISDNPNIRAEAVMSGADFALSPTELLQNLEKIVQDYARVPHPELMAQLDCECVETLPDLAKEAIQQFNQGHYYRQHDLFEELWMKTEGPVRDLYRAALQVGIAYYQIERGNYRGALKMLQRSVQWLLILPEQCQGIDVQKLREDSFRVRAELERLGEDRFSEFDKSLIHPLKFDG